MLKGQKGNGEHSKHKGSALKNEVKTMDNPKKSGNTVTIIDYGSGNLKSISNALASLGYGCSITPNPDVLPSAEMLLFPGVGSFGSMMRNLSCSGMDVAIRKSVSSGIPFLGICLGLQALFDSSEESAGVAGLGLIKGKVKRFQKGKVPQIGWNEVIPNSQGIIPRSNYYFVNSYYAVPEDRSMILAQTEYHVRFPSAIRKSNITAVQFHPELSGQAGLQFLKNWLVQNSVSQAQKLSGGLP